MDPILSSLFPINKIGSDGFSWWIGQVENIKDPKKGGRVQVRIVGEHLRDATVVATESLPWAYTMMPVTTPYSDGGETGASSNLNPGNWVIGFYMDNDKQKPIIMGSIPHTPGSTKIVGDDPDPGGTAKNLTRYISSEANPSTDFAEADNGKPTASSDNETGYEEGSVTTGAQPAASQRASEKGGLPPAVSAAFKKNSETNPTGGQFCVVVANPNCGAEKNLKSNLTHIIGEMLAANQNSGGQLGDYYVSKVNGELYSHVDQGKYHIGRVKRLINSSIARAKGEVITVLRDGATSIVDTLLYEPSRPIVPDDIDLPLTDEQKELVEEASKALTDALNSGDQASIDAADEGFQSILEDITGERGHPTIKPKESRLKEVQDWLDGAVKDLGCKFKDITDRIYQYITDLLLKFLNEAYSAATCLVDEVINNILSQIFGLIDDAISAILEPLQAILGFVADIGNMIGKALKKVTDLLGLVCTGPEAQCEKIQITCTDCTNSSDDEDDLDKLIAAVEDGNLDYSNSVCVEATLYPEEEDTIVTFVGGVFVPTRKQISYTCEDIEAIEGQDATFTIKRSGDTNVSSALSVYTLDDTATRGLDYDFAFNGAISLGTGILAFAPGETEKKIIYNTYSDSVSDDLEQFLINIQPLNLIDGTDIVFPDGKNFVCTIREQTNTPLTATPPPTTPLTGRTPPPTPPPTVPLVPTTPPTIGGGGNNNTKTQSVPGAYVSSTPTQYISYSVSPNKSFADEGETITFTITTNGVADNTTLGYTLSGIQANDLDGSGLTGTFTIQNGTATVDIKTATDNDTAAEVLLFTIDNTSANASVTINAGTSTAPNYRISADRTTATEGDVITYTINTRNVADGTSVGYTLSGVNITADDFTPKSLTGSVTINSNVGTFTVTTVDDGSIEGNEVLTCTVNNTTASVDVVLQDPALPTVTPTASPTYTITTDKLQYDEGDNIQYTIVTTNVPDGSILEYTLFGTNVTKDDFALGTLKDKFTVTSNRAVVNVLLADDNVIEFNETVRFQIVGTSSFADVVILGQEQSTAPTTAPVVRCLTKPTAKATTDSNGRLLSVTIDDFGCPYQNPPAVIIGGAGYGAAAIPELDANGYLTNVKLTRTGIGYKSSPPEEQTTCIVTSFTMLRPGSGYTSTPTVYVDGDDTIAEAIVEDGFVTDIRIKDRTLAFKTIPRVLIVGGDGYGARFLANLSCLDNKELERRGYASIGTGKYIDCP